MSTPAASPASPSSLPVILTGDRPTGPLHIGHYIGSLRSRVEMQHNHKVFILVADTQALTDNADNPAKVRNNVLEVALDYLAVGIDPSRVDIFIQSQVPELTELTSYYLNYVTVARLERNPTVKAEIQQRGFERDIPAGFLTYPVSQAADITAFKATLVPVGDDQVPMIEQTNEIVRRVNRLLGRDWLPEARAVLSATSRLPGIDGGAKMSKSLGNTITLSASADDIKHAVKMMYTDPGHLRVSDPGKVEGNVVFTYLDAFDPNKDEVAELKAHYQRGGLGDMVLKRRLESILNDVIGPMRERRAHYAKDPGEVFNILRKGTTAARAVAANTVAELKRGLGLDYFDR